MLRHFEDLLKARLPSEEWVEGRIITTGPISYRHGLTVVCSKHGRQTARFKNSVNGSYFVYGEIYRGSEPAPFGGNFVTFLQSMKSLWVVEQRPAQWNPALGLKLPTHIRFDDNRVLDMTQFGPYPSLECPGGFAAQGKISSGLLRQLYDETEVSTQSLRFFRRNIPYFHFGSDMSVANYYGVALLSNGAHPDKVKADGGLALIELTVAEVDRLIMEGVIVSGQAALAPWWFYKTIESVIDAERNGRDSRRGAEMVNAGYLLIEDMKVG